MKTERAKIMRAARKRGTLLEQLERLEREATPGPWKSNVWYGVDDGGFAAVGPYHCDEDACPDGCEPSCPCDKEAMRDAELITVMRNALPALLAVVEAAQDVIRVRDVLEHPADVAVMVRIQRLATALAELEKEAKG